MALPEGVIEATWVGPYGHRLADGTLLETGITVCEIGVHEAVGSDNWKPVNVAQANKLVKKLDDDDPEPEPEPEPATASDDGGDD